MGIPITKQNGWAKKLTKREISGFSHNFPQNKVTLGGTRITNITLTSRVKVRNFENKLRRNDVSLIAS